MLFIKENWDEASDIRKVIPVSVSTEFDSLEGPLSNAFETFIRELVGETMAARLIALAREYDNEISEKEKRALALARRANVYLAFWYNYNEMQLHIDDSGAHRQESDNARSLYKYQEQDLKTSWKEKGFNAIDDLLAYLEQELVEFEEYAASPYFAKQNTDIVRTAKEVNEVYFIGESRIVYLRLRPHFKTVIDTVVAPRMGEIYDEMIAELAKTTPDEKYVKLRDKLVPVVIFYAVSRLIRETGSLTDKGLYFESLEHYADNISLKPGALDRISMQGTMAEGDAISYWMLAERYMKTQLGFVSSGAARIPKADNNNKKAFWA